MELVALLAEGVDRNNINLIKMILMKKSPTSRRAWKKNKYKEQ